MSPSISSHHYISLGRAEAASPHSGEGKEEGGAWLLSGCENEWVPGLAHSGHLRREQAWGWGGDVGGACGWRYPTPQHSLFFIRWASGYLDGTEHIHGHASVNILVHFIRTVVFSSVRGSDTLSPGRAVWILLLTGRCSHTVPTLPAVGTAAGSSCGF